jgi:hypothetical protein
MIAYRIHNYIIAADVEEEAVGFYTGEIGGMLPDVIEEVSVSTEVPAEDGNPATIRDIINRVLDERSEWLKLGVPCDLHAPFIIKKL